MCLSVLGSCLHPWAPGQHRGRATPAQGGLSLEDGLLRREPTPQKGRGMLQVLSPLGNWGKLEEETEGVEEKEESEPLLQPSLATLRLPQGAVAAADGGKSSS